MFDVRELEWSVKQFVDSQYDNSLVCKTVC